MEHWLSALQAIAGWISDGEIRRQPLNVRLR